MEQESAFNELKHRLTIAPVLAYPDFSRDAGLFVLDTDASQPLGIGVFLSRLQRNDTDAENWQKTFSRCNNAGNHTTLRETDQNIFLCYKAEWNVF